MRRETTGRVGHNVPGFSESEHRRAAQSRQAIACVRGRGHFAAVSAPGPAASEPATKPRYSDARFRRLQSFRFGGRPDLAGLAVAAGEGRPLREGLFPQNHVRRAGRG